MLKLSPLYKGIITGLLMLGVAIGLSFQAYGARYDYLVYCVYATGIAWTLYGYYRSEKYTGKFSNIFGQGFRCFIIVTLIMVIFTGVYSKAHPEIAEQQAKLYREYLVKEGNKLPETINTEVADYKKQFTTRNISLAIFGYLVIGVFFTAAGAGILLMRRK